MSTWALVPVKARAAGKTRLASCLPPEQRIALVRAMLAHVLATLRAVPAIDHIALVSPERDQVAEDILLLPDPDQQLNTSLEAALRTVAAKGARYALVVSADLPLLAPTEIAALLSAGAQRKLALAPDRAGQGTNALALNLPGEFHLQLGMDSYARHCEQAARLGLAVQRIDAPGLAFDVDRPEDVDALNMLSPHWMRQTIMERR